MAWVERIRDDSADEEEGREEPGPIESVRLPSGQVIAREDAVEFVYRAREAPRFADAFEELPLVGTVRGFEEGEQGLCAEIDVTDLTNANVRSVFEPDEDADLIVVDVQLADITGKVDG